MFAHWTFTKDTSTPEDEVTAKGKLTIDVVLVTLASTTLASEHIPFDSIELLLIHTIFNLQQSKIIVVARLRLIRRLRIMYLPLYLARCFE